MTNEPEET